MNSSPIHLYLAQTSQLGQDKALIAQLLQRHGVLVRGGQLEAQKLMDALLVCDACCRYPELSGDMI